MTPAEILPLEPATSTILATRPALTSAGEAAMAAAEALAKNAAAPATLRACKAGWPHFSQWCAVHGLIPSSGPQEF